MRGRIPREFIDELLARLDVVEVIDRRVPLKKAGKDFKACCPFHNEKTPSFTVSQPKQFYHCFGCGVSGTAVTFLMEFEHLSFPEAVEELAGEAGPGSFPIPGPPGPATTQRCRCWKPWAKPAVTTRINCAHIATPQPQSLI